MAVLVSSTATGFALDVVIAALDNNNVQYERTKSFQFNPGVILYADAVLAAQAMIADLDGINEADIIRYSVRTLFETSTGPVTAVGDVFKEAIMTIRIAGQAVKKATHTVYSPADANITGKTFIVDAAVNAYLDAFQTGGDFQMSDGEDISTDEATRVAASRVRKVASGKRS